MAHLSHIKSRILTVQKTQKITKAMRLIAMSFYSKLERQRSMLTAYRTATNTLTSLLSDGYAVLPAAYQKKQSATQHKSGEHALTIVCSSAKGLCGGLNNNLIRFFERSSISTQTTKPSLIAIGNKACSYLKESNYGTIIDRIPEYHLSTISSIAQTIVSHIWSQKVPYTSVTIFYTHLKNFFLQVPNKLELIPLSLEKADAATEKQSLANKERYLWEQDPEKLGEALVKQHLYSALVHALFNNLISENAARFIAMDQSTNNAKKYLEALNLAYNKSRQNTITREIAEISSTLE
ncbi:MAG: FoF1 ATP synthase subunit gamma [bacterium]